MPSIGQVPSGASYFQHHCIRPWINLQLGTSFLFLNVNTLPPNNYACARLSIWPWTGGRVVAGQRRPSSCPADLPDPAPGLAGYHRYCPLHLLLPQPTAAGAHQTRRAPCLAIAASGTAGMQVTVWNVFPTPQGAVKEAEYMVQTLRQLGYRASLRLLPDSTFSSGPTNDSRNHVQVIDGGWSADYTSADDFIGKLACDYFVPGNGLATTDAGEFCDPGLDRQIARAAAQQATNPAAAAALWAQLRPETHRPGDLGSTVTPNEIDFLSSRGRTFLFHPAWGASSVQFWI